jgi:hypothetical protein
MLFIQFILDEDYGLCIISIMHQQLWGYKVEQKLHLRVLEQKVLNTTGTSIYILLPPFFLSVWAWLITESIEKNILVYEVKFFRGVTEMRYWGEQVST